MRDLRLKHAALLFSFILLACQDSDLDEINDIQEEDLDMIEGHAAMEEYFSNTRADYTDKDMTILRCNKHGELFFKTNTFKGSYESIDERTVTARSQAGGFVFWRAGSRVDELNKIILSDKSQQDLGNSTPFEVKEDELWALWIPANIDPSVKALKYDIIYTNDLGERVRLDPKIKIEQQLQEDDD